MPAKPKRKTVNPFDSIWDNVSESLAKSGAVLDEAELSRRRARTAEVWTKYATDANDPAPPTDVPVDEPEPETLIIPAPPTDPYWYDDPEYASTLDHYILARRALGSAMNGALLITGEAGYGKTVSVRKSVERINALRYDEREGDDLRLFRMDCATVTDPAKWFGRREADETGTHFVPSDFWIAVERGDVVLLDDVMKVHPHIHNSITSLLDGSESVDISDLNETLFRNRATVFIATANEGSKYGGQHRIDWSMRERFSTTLRREPPPPDEEIRILTSATNCDEDAAAVLVAIAQKTREMHQAGDLNTAISTRTLVAAATWVGFGKREWDALNITAVQEFDGDASGMTGAESDRQKVLGIMEGRLGRAQRR